MTRYSFFRFFLSPSLLMGIVQSFLFRYTSSLRFIRTPQTLPFSFVTVTATITSTHAYTRIDGQAEFAKVTGYIARSSAVAHPTTNRNRAQCRATSLIETNALRQTAVWRQTNRNLKWNHLILNCILARCSLFHCDVTFPIFDCNIPQNCQSYGHRNDLYCVEWGVKP